jgi:hypothetical protein
LVKLVGLMLSKTSSGGQVRLCYRRSTSGGLALHVSATDHPPGSSRWGDMGPVPGSRPADRAVFGMAIARQIVELHGGSLTLAPGLAALAMPPARVSWQATGAAAGVPLCTLPVGDHDALQAH